MTTYTIVALIVLPIVGGFIAWAGDVIGYRLGKSRRTLLGLRPRTTARVVGIFVGVLLPLGTMLLAAAGSSYVRIALFQLAELTRSREELKQENFRLRASVEMSREQKEAAQQAATKAQKSLETATEELDYAQAQLGEVEAQLQSSQARLRTVQEERQQIAEQRDKLTADVKKLEAERSSLQTKLDMARGQLNLTRQNLVEVKASLQTTESTLAETETELAAAEKQLVVLTVEVAKLKLQADGLRARAESARMAMENAERALEGIEQTLQAKEEEYQMINEQLEQQRELLAFSAQLLQRQSWLMGTGKVRYEPGMELVRATIATDETQAQVESSLNELLFLASQRAAVAGAGLAESGRAVQLIAPIPPEATEQYLTENLIVNSVAQRIRQAEADTCVIVVRVVLRSFVGDGLPVAVELWMRANVLVYPRGYVIAHQEIDGSGPRAEVFQQVWGLLGQLRQVAQRASIMRDPETGQYGLVPAEQLLSLFDELVSRQESLTVEAVAAEDVYVAGRQPFLVLLRIGEPEPTEGEASEPGPGPRA